MIEFEDDDDYKHEYNDFIDCVIISTLSSLYDEYGWKLASHSSDKLEYILKRTNFNNEKKKEYNNLKITY